MFLQKYCTTKRLDYFQLIIAYLIQKTVAKISKKIGKTRKDLQYFPQVCEGQWQSHRGAGGVNTSPLF